MLYKIRLTRVVIHVFRRFLSVLRVPLGFFGLVLGVIGLFLGIFMILRVFGVLGYLVSLMSQTFNHLEEFRYSIRGFQ